MAEAENDLTYEHAKALVDEHGSIRKAAANSPFSRDKIMRVLNGEKTKKTMESDPEPDPEPDNEGEGEGEETKGSEEPPAGIGHNSEDTQKAKSESKSNYSDTQGITGDQLKSYIERIEKLEEEKANIATDIREVYSEAKANGFNTKVMRQLVRLRKMDQQDRSQQEELLHIYKTAIGME